MTHGLDRHSGLTVNNAHDIAAEVFGAADELASVGFGQTVVEIISDRYLNQAIGAC